jgi:hypothetical protein
VVLDGTIKVVTKEARCVVDHFVHELGSLAEEFAFRNPELSIEMTYKQELDTGALEIDHGGHNRR